MDKWEAYEYRDNLWAVRDEGSKLVGMGLFTKEQARAIANDHNTVQALTAERDRLLVVLEAASRLTEGREYGLYLPDRTFVAMPAGNVMVREEVLNDLLSTVGKCAFIDQQAIERMSTPDTGERGEEAG